MGIYVVENNATSENPLYDKRQYSLTYTENMDETKKVKNVSQNSEKNDENNQLNSEADEMVKPLLEIKQMKLDNILHGLDMMRKNRQFCDVVIQVGTAELYAHRAVLACSSPYFFELFNQDEDKRCDGMLVYRLNGGIERDCMDKLIDFAYTGRLSVSEKDVKNLYATASKLKMESVVDQCGHYLLDYLSPTNCVGLRSLLNESQNNQLVDKVDKYIESQMKEIANSKELQNLPCIRVEVMKLSKANTCHMNHNLLAAMVLDWIKRSSVEDEDLTMDMLTEKNHMLYLNLDQSLHDCQDIESGDANDCEHVQDYKKLSKRHSHPFIKGRRKHSDVKPKNPAVKQYLYDTLSLSFDSENSEAWKTIGYTEISMNSILALVTIKGKLAVLSIMQRLQSPSPLSTPGTSRPPSLEKSSDLKLFSKMSSAKCALGAAVLNDKIFVCGGYDRGECLSVAEMFDPISNEWCTIPSMLRPRARFGIAVMGGKVYAVGGCDGCKDLDTIEMYNLKTNKWTKAGTIPSARSNAGVCCLDNYIYCIGGCIGQTCIKDCIAYNSDTREITPIPNLHVGRYQAGITCMNDEIVVVGGSDAWHALSSVEIFNKESQTWRFIPSMTTARRGCGVVFYQDKLWVVGGSDGSKSLCSTEIFDPDLNMWSPGPNLTSCRANVSVVVINDKMYVIGGFSGKVFLNTVECYNVEAEEWTTFIENPIDNWGGETVELERGTKDIIFNIVEDQAENEGAGQGS